MPWPGAPLRLATLPCSIAGSGLLCCLTAGCLLPPGSPLQVDVFALGVILNECWTRRQPWRDSNHFFQIILRECGGLRERGSCKAAAFAQGLLRWLRLLPPA